MTNVVDVVVACLIDLDIASNSLDKALTDIDSKLPMETGQHGINCH